MSTNNAKDEVDFLETKQEQKTVIVDLSQIKAGCIFLKCHKGSTARPN